MMTVTILMMASLRLEKKLTRFSPCSPMFPIMTPNTSEKQMSPSTFMPDTYVPFCKWTRGEVRTFAQDVISRYHTVTTGYHRVATGGSKELGSNALRRCCTVVRLSIFPVLFVATTW